jgi:putative tryptophan/tyrosine transport system substrate-binding protein
MRRREFISLVGGATLGWPLGAAAQQSGRMRHISVLIGGTPNDPQISSGLDAFKAALGELGWLDGRNIQIDYQFAAADVERMHPLARELVAKQPDLIVGRHPSSPR